MHGGSTPHGAALPQTQHGRYSRHLPTRLSERYHEAAADPELLALREDIALLDTRLADLLTRVDSGESGKLWLDLKKFWTQFKDCQSAGDELGQMVARSQIDYVVETGAADFLAWTEIAALLEQRRKLVESEQKRLVAMQQTVTAEQAMLLVTAIVETVRTHVRDRSVLSAISADIERLAAQAGS